jgi:hypothetical protein
MGHRGLVGRSEIGNIRYRLCVVARDVSELVDLAGGWMCDRILAGWDVSVSVSEPCDLRPHGGAAGNRTRVLRHSLKASPCAVRYASTRVSRSRELAGMTTPVAVCVPMSPATELIGGSL